MEKELLDRLTISTTSPIRVIFDESHGESWTISSAKAKEVNPRDVPNCSFEELAHILRHNNYIVNRNTRFPITREILNACDVFVIAHPVDKKIIAAVEGEPIFTKEELNEIENWVKCGGALLILYEHNVETWGSNINELAKQFGITFNDDCLVDSIHYLGHPTTVSIVVAENNHPILKDISQIFYYAGCTLSTTGEAYGILFSDSDAIPPLSPIIAGCEFGQGRVLCIGDGDLFDPTRIKEGDHNQLALNMFSWLSNSVPNVVINQEILLFSNNYVLINRVFQNIGSVEIPSVSLKDVNQNIKILEKDYIASSGFELKPGERKLVKFMLNLDSSLGNELIGNATVNLTFITGSTVKFSIPGVTVNLKPFVGGRPSITFNEKNILPDSSKVNISLMPVCPLNFGKCSLVNRIGERYRKARVFLDIPYRKNYAHFEKAIRNTLTKYGLIPVAAKDRQVSTILLCNVCEGIQTCGFAIADVSEFNPNILYELGLIHALGKKAAILRYEEAGNITDIQGLLYISYANTDDIEKKLSAWIVENYGG